MSRATQDLHRTDYVIVGAGSAGCVLANRLTADGRHHVTLLEAGGSDRRFWVRVPFGYSRTFVDARVNWKYTTASIASLDHRRIYWPSGKLLGGSSSINAMVYIRGHARDFDDWERAGNPGWGFSDLLPYFRRSEDNDQAPDPFHARGGELHVSSTHNDLHPLCSRWLRAGEQAGFAQTDDFNGARMEGVGIYQITTRDGRRESTATAFLHPARSRKNLRVVTHAHATRVVFEGTRAVGVEFVQRGQRHTIVANKEVIVAAGAIGSPQLLERSGIGDPDRLRPLGIEVVQSNTNVGEHLQDHLSITYFFRSVVPTLNGRLKPLRGQLREVARYLLTRQGCLCLGVNQAGGFLKSTPTRSDPNLQLYFRPLSYTSRGTDGSAGVTLDPFPGFSIGFQPCRPTSRGCLHITSSDPTRGPRIEPNYLANEDDVVEAVEGCRLVRRLARAPALAEVIIEEHVPGPHVQEDAELLEDLRARADTIYHPVGTCRMGNTAATSVVDPELRVHGIHGLRVADASVFPNLTSGNTNAPTIMVAEKASDLIRSAQRDSP